MKSPSKILLGPSTSKALSDAGTECFLVIGKASHPDDPTRWILHIVPSTIPMIDAAARVALGKARAVKVKKLTSSD